MENDLLDGFLAQLRARRKRLGMPLDAVVRKSGVSRATVARLLKGRYTNARFNHVIRIAEALGVKVQFDENAGLTCRPIPEEDYLRAQARTQAKRLVGLVQGNMALEAQAIDGLAVTQLEEKACRTLLDGPKKRLWGF